MLDLRAILELLEDRQQAAVDDHGAIAGVIRDVREVVRVQSQVQCVQDEAAARDPEVGLVVLVMVPAQCRDPVAALEAETPQRDGELPRALHRVLVRRAMEALVGEARDDLAVPEVRLGAPQEMRERQLEIHHQSVHGTPPARG